MTGPSGLRRFVGATSAPNAPGPPGAPDAPNAPGPPNVPEAANTANTAGATSAAAGAAHPEAEPCEMCNAPAGPRHGHVVDTENRSLMCACRACYLLFTRSDAGGARFRSVPERYHTDHGHPLTKVEWEGLGIPVGAVFFLRGADGISAFYPSPAGATECLLDLDAWAMLGQEHPMLTAAAAEVEAILIHSTDGGDTVECYLVPIDVCYQLVGLVRTYWQGFDGGQEAHEHIEEFFGGIRAAARPFTGEE